MPPVGAPKTSMFVAGAAALKGPKVEKLASWLFSSVPATRRMPTESGELSSVPVLPAPFTTKSPCASSDCESACKGGKVFSVKGGDELMLTLIGPGPPLSCW